MKKNHLTAFLLIAFLLMFFKQNFGQTYLGLNGGFESTATIDNTNTYSSGQVNKWSKANASQTISNETGIVRSGNNSLKLNNNSTIGRRCYSPTFSPTTGQRLVIQYYRRVTNPTNTQQSECEISRDGTTAIVAVQSSYSVPPSSDTWEKVTFAPTSADYVSNIFASVIHKQTGTGGDLFIDDIAIYTATTADISPPSSATSVIINPNSTNPTSSLDISWTAASGGVDGGGYLVVRYSLSPNADNDPNVNGIYAEGNTITNGTGALIGTVVFNGTATSFTNTGLSSATTYYYKVYTYDKAYNYSNETQNSGATSSPNHSPTLDAINNINIPQNSSSQIVNFTGITDGGDGGQTLSVTASSNNTSLISNPAVSYTSPNTTGSLSFTLVSGASGTATITITVTDNGGTANGGVNTFSRQFIVNIAAPGQLTYIYYPKISATDLSMVSNWTDDQTGVSGTSPLDFTSPNQVFNITRNPFVSGAWIISGGSNVILSVTGLTFNPTSSLTVGSGSNFDFGGNNNFTTTFKSIQTNTAYFGQLNGTISNATNITVERFISSQSNRAYRLLAPSVNTAGSSKQFIRDNWQEGTNNPNTSTINNPVPGYGIQITGSATGSNGFDATQSGQSSLFIYNQTTPAYVAVPNTDAITFDGKTAYLVYIRGDRTVDLTSQTSPLPSSNTTLRTTGSLLTGLQTYSSLANAGGFSLVTNPYASSISWNLIHNHSGTSNFNNFESYYTYMDPNIGSRGGYVTVSDAGVVNPDPGTSSPAVPAGTVNIQSGQAFFVQTKTGINSPTLTIQESDKTAVNNIDVFRTATPPAQKFTASLYYNDTEHGRRLADGVTELYDDSYNTAVDGDDAVDLGNFDENIAIAKDGKLLSIEERPIIKTIDTLHLFMSNMKQQVYEYEFNPTNLNPGMIAQLVDNYTGGKTFLDVTAKTVVPFTVSSATASSASDRFYIIFRPTASGALPVTLTSVKAYQKNTGAQIEWITQQEINIDRYEVERSSDVQPFIKIGSVNTKANNSSSVINYNLFDASPFSGINFYRIKIIDKGGKIIYSQVVKVNISIKANQVTVAPNPIHSNTIILQMNNIQKGSYTIILTNKLGQDIATKVIDHAGGSSIENITPAKVLSNGVYQLRITGNGINTTLQILKN